MIKFTLAKSRHKATLRVPATENEIEAFLTKCESQDFTDVRVYVDNVESDIEELKRLEGTEQGIDYLNLLGRVMYGMDSGEYEQFRYGLWWEEAFELKEMINIAMTPNRYSIIDENKLYESGLDHELNLRGGIPTSEVKVTDYSAIARKLLDSGKCEDTPYGKKLFVNNEIPIENFFDGKHLPAYFDNNKFVFAVGLENENGEDYIFLPCSTNEIMRSANRLKCFYPCDLSIRIEDCSLSNENLDNLFANADIYTLNNFAMLMSELSESERCKFLSVVDYSRKYFNGENSLANVVKIGEKLSSFNYVTDVSNAYDFGRYLILRSGEYAFDESLEPYFDFNTFGEDIVAKEAGQFFDDCYVGITNYDEVKQFLCSNEMSLQ